MSKSKKRSKKKKNQTTKKIQVSGEMAEILRKAALVRTLSSYVVIGLAIIILVFSKYVKAHPNSNLATYFKFFVPFQQIVLAIMFWSLMPAINFKYSQTKSKKDLLIMTVISGIAIFLIFLAVFTVIGYIRMK